MRCACSLLLVVVVVVVVALGSGLRLVTGGRQPGEEPIADRQARRTGFVRRDAPAVASRVREWRRLEPSVSEMGHASEEQLVVGHRLSLERRASQPRHASGEYRKAFVGGREQLACDVMEPPAGIAE